MNSPVVSCSSTFSYRSTRRNPRFCRFGSIVQCDAGYCQIPNARWKLGYVRAVRMMLDQIQNGPNLAWGQRGMDFCWITRLWFFFTRSERHTDVEVLLDRIGAYTVRYAKIINDLWRLCRMCKFFVFSTGETTLGIVCSPRKVIRSIPSRKPTHSTTR